MTKMKPNKENIEISCAYPERASMTNQRYPKTKLISGASVKIYSKNASSLFSLRIILNKSNAALKVSPISRSFLKIFSLKFSK